MVRSVSALGLDPRSFRLVAESESSCLPGSDPTAVHTHEDGEPCHCPWECVEVCDAWLDAQDAHRFPH